MKSELHYRLADKRDALELHQVAYKAYSTYFDLLSEEGAAQLNTSIRNTANLDKLLEQSTCFVCTHHEKVVGAAYFISSGHPWDVFKAEWSYIRMVGVVPDYQGLGIARELTRQCVEQAKASKETTIALHTSEFMDAARHIYESLGFKQQEEIPKRLGKRYWLYVMHLE